MSDARNKTQKNEHKKGRHYTPKIWFAIDFAVLDIWNDECLVNFINRWTPQSTQYNSMSNPDGLYITKISEYIESQLNVDDRESEVTNLISAHRTKLVPFQEEIRSFIEDFNKMGETNNNRIGTLEIIEIVNTDKIERLNELLGRIRFKVTTELLPGYTMKQVIVPNLIDFECCLYYNFMEYIKSHSAIITCIQCGNYISNPSMHQLANAKRNYPSLHKECEYDYRLSKDRKRKKNGGK
ncbi:hypothetical protein [Paenibacillus tundrae]|uniref:hypothetical protein n=1 Tax=Paenibacillus tundrae TaxID=528187 RepID=UPI0022A96D66|nr:hypothetical protein [Paenibacillus tundrae]MCZ1269126.1 hypothetical protein [Paenibacillus tundrae]